MFGNVISDFTDNLAGLREFLALIEPYLQKHLAGFLESRASDLAPLLLAVAKLHPDKIANMEEAENKLQELFGGELDVTVSQEGGKPRISKISIASKDNERVAKATSAFQQATRHPAFLYRSCLEALTNAAEWFLSQLLHLYCSRFPDAIGGKDLAFSLDDLKRIGSIEEARNHLVDTRIENVLRGSFDDWVSHLKGKLGLALGYLEPHRDRLNEVFQRRNLVVHNNGIINSIYLSRIAPELREGLVKGRPLTFSRSYLDASIDLFQSCFTLMAAELWKKLDTDDTARGELLIILSYGCLCQERWSVAEASY
jgi:hypothetical protein